MSLGQEDGYLRSQCKDCKAMDNYRGMTGYRHWETFQNNELRNKPCERAFHFHKTVIDEVTKSRPDKMIVLMCYTPTTRPPKEIKYFGNSVIDELMRLNPEYIKAWQGKTNGLTG